MHPNKTREYKLLLFLNSAFKGSCKLRIKSYNIKLEIIYFWIILDDNTITESFRDFLTNLTVIKILVSKPVLRTGKGIEQNKMLVLMQKTNLTK